MVERGGRTAFKGLVDVLAKFCISSLVIICFVKSFHELNIRFFGPAVSHCAASKRSNCDFAISPVRVRWPRIQTSRRRCAKRERCHGRHAPAGEQPRRRRLRIGLPAPTACFFSPRARVLMPRSIDAWRSAPALERGGAEQLLCV